MSPELDKDRLLYERVLNDSRGDPRSHPDKGPEFEWSERFPVWLRGSWDDCRNIWDADEDVVLTVDGDGVIWVWRYRAWIKYCPAKAKGRRLIDEGGEWIFPFGFLRR